MRETPRATRSASPPRPSTPATPCPSPRRAAASAPHHAWTSPTSGRAPSPTRPSCASSRTLLLGLGSRKSVSKEIEGRRTGTTLLAREFSDENRHRVQAMNESIVFGTQASVSLLAGVAVHRLGCEMLNAATLPLLAVMVLAAGRLRRLQSAVAGADPNELK